MTFTPTTPGATSSLPPSVRVPGRVPAGAAIASFELRRYPRGHLIRWHSQLVGHFQVPLSDTIATQYKLVDKFELHIGAEYIFFIKNIPLAARGGFYTNPDHKIKYEGPSTNAEAVGERLIYAGGKDRYQGTAGLGIVPFPGFQLDFAGNYGKDLLEFSVSSVFRF
jgi:hypothetical protein